MLSFKGNLGSEAKTAERTELLVLCSSGIKKKTVFNCNYSFEVPDSFHFLILYTSARHLSEDFYASYSTPCV